VASCGDSASAAGNSRPEQILRSTTRKRLHPIVRYPLAALWIATSVLFVGLLLVPLGIVAGIGALLALARWIERHVAYGGDTAAQSKDKWRGM
jgi:uncharacterized membrane protein